MAISYFRISRLPIRVDLLKSASPVVLNTSYPIAEENELSIDNSSGFKHEFLDSFGYQVSEDNVVWSNEGNVNIKELVGTNTPESANYVLEADEDTEYNFSLTPYFSFNTSVDRIKITNISGNGFPKLNGNPLSVGQEIYNYNISNITFETLEGGGLPYAVISYQCGNHLGYNTATTYTITIDVSTLAEIAFVSRTTNIGSINIASVDYDRHSNLDVIQLSKGLIGKLAKLTLVITSPMFSDSVNNSMVFRYNNTEVTKTANETFDIFPVIGNDGKFLLEIEHIFVDVSGSTTSSSVDITIIDVDGDSGNVSVTDNYISTVNYN